MNFKQFRRPANNHSRMKNGRGSRGFRLQSKLGPVMSLARLERLLRQDEQRRNGGNGRTVHTYLRGSGKCLP